ncbi:UNVERIFIED_CONTAM: hypothetical protein Sradi_3966500 [Sesamum radiatum]|uniref:Uncharacterized protein n=1 Tax=Sesamum radiatum TaxID=300843 RepID=A0AAW2PKY6_SESRA
MEVSFLVRTCVPDSVGRCKDKFLHPVRLLKLGGYDLVLGCDWLSNFYPVELYFHQLKVTLSQGEERLILRTLPKETRTKFMATHSLAKLMRRKNREIEGELFFNHKVLMGGAEDNKVQELLQKYDDVFKEPNSLPLEREIEHCIELLPDTIPRKQHPYIYAYGKKTEIEKIVKEMLDSGMGKLQFWSHMYKGFAILVPYLSQ